MTLRERRESLNMTQVQLAEMIGTSPGRISNWESGCGMSMKYIIAVAKALKCSVADIMAGR